VIRKLSVFLTIVAMVSGAAIVSQAHPQSLLTRHVRPVTLNGQAKSVGLLPAVQPLRVDIVLPVRDQAGLDSFLQQVYDPSSVFYRHFLTVQEFTERFGPSQQDYDAVISFGKTSGFTVVGGSRDAMDVQLQGSVRTIEAAFHVTMGLYQHPTENRTFYAPDREPTVDLPFQLWHITGLDNYSIPRPLFVKKNDPGVISNATTGSCPGNAFCGSDMRAAYYGGTALTGSGQNIGLLEYAGFNITDVNTYYTNSGQTRTATVTGVSTDGSSVNCNYPQCDDTEQTIDITQALGMAPGASTVFVYVSDSSDTALLGGMSSGTPLPLNLSSSWTWTPADPKTDDPFFQKMAVQGQSFFQASGDSAEWRSSTFPSDDPNVICVGGTDLTTTGKGGSWATETAWASSGGGFYAPDKMPIPTWQQLPGVITSTNKGSTVWRNGPDVSANSNYTFYVCADQGKNGPCTSNLYGGTSFAAPMWAGYLALTNQQASANGDPAPGFINPVIYPLGLGSDYATEFHDITSGTNGFPAVAGFDLVTGWGSPNGAGLINALAPVQAGDFTISVSPNAVTIPRGSMGSATITTAVSGGFDSTIDLSGSGNPQQVAVIFRPTSINGAGTARIGIKVGTGARLGSSTITIMGMGGDVTHTTTLTLTVTN
jgi:subtilase family serine protease